MRPRFLVLLLSAILSSRCTPAPDRTPSPAFYYWKTTFTLSPTERAQLDSLHCKTLYIKFLDVGRSAETGGQITPLALLEVLDTAGLADRTVVPCVFLTNSVFQGLTGARTDWLADHTVLALRSVGRQFPDTVFSEVQFDCDWTPSTRAAYFSFLQKVKSRLGAGTAVSATIRLHQYKFPAQTGVPPVDRGMLMFYNTGDLDDPGEQNSIFEPADARTYLHGAPRHYPVPLDVALPVFSWAVIYRDGAFFRLLPGFTDEQLADTARFLRLEPRRAEVRRNTFQGGLFLRPGDVLRVEGLDAPALREAASWAAKTDLQGPFHVAFFDLDSAVCRRFPVPEIRACVDRIRQD